MSVQDPLERLRLELRAAAEREVTPRVRSRRRWRQGGLALVGALLVSGGVATGVNLIDEGAPDRTGNAVLSTYSSARATDGTLWVQSREKGQPLSFGVLAYRRHGDRCAQAGFVRGNDLGSYSGGAFHAFTGKGGSCIHVKDKATFNSFYLHGRMLTFGRAPVGTKTVKVVARETGDIRTAPVAPNGAFLVTLDGTLDGNKLDITFTPPVQ